jgi:putative endonuclease
MSKRWTYYVYIMSSLSRTLYTGVTNNLERRVAEHKARRPGSFTARYNVTKLVYCEEFDDISQVIGRESDIKQMARSTEIALTESTNPEWRDLSAE